VAHKELLDKISIYVPKNKLDQKPVERLMKLAETKDRSINYLVVEAIVEYLAREERRKN
jgi:predicted transcriptional regulator